MLENPIEFVLDDWMAKIKAVHWQKAQRYGKSDANERASDGGQIGIKSINSEGQGLGVC
jgi:hypothetical protein